MQTFFIRHKLSVGDISHLSDSDSELVISEGKLKIEDIIEVETYENVFLAQITDISKSSVEIEILQDKGKRENTYIPSITVIQSLSNDTKFNYFLEKSIEIGVEKIVPIESSYSLRTKNKAIKDWGLWNKIINDATEQSRTTFPTIITKPVHIKELLNYSFDKEVVRLCLATENVGAKYLEEVEDLEDRPVCIAIGPEKGWSSSDLDIFTTLGFEYVKLRGNILRTETAGLVISSIVKYIKGEI
jgi:16S rRNA (uracil1498-N3)-methyltransferase